MRCVKFDSIPQIYYYNAGYTKEDHQYWMQVGMDRERFQRRINKFHKIINNILLKKNK